VPRAEPRYFGPAGRVCFGWLHRPPADRPPPPVPPPRAAGLVICNPFGHEAVSAHRALRHFAEAAAALGVPALRFDYHGTGDSTGDDREPGRWEAWLASVDAAVDELRRAAGLTHVYLLGVRLGATLAALAASRRDDVAGLVAVVPVVSGKQWWRETRAMENAMQLAAAPPGRELPAGQAESVGFVITEETRAALGAVDLLGLERRPAARVLLLDRDDLPPNDRFAARLRELGGGAEVDHRRVPGYAGMMLDPHDAVVPGEMVRAVSAWLDRQVPAAGAGTPPAPTSPAAAGPVPVAPGVTETADFLDGTRTLFGIVTAPAAATSPTRAIVLLNAGAVNRIGPNRLYVELARRWAGRGHLVLRFDQAGIGDSPPWPGEEENIVYSPSAVRDLECALQHLAERRGIATSRALGLCSGAYHAFKAAAQGLAVERVVIINPLVFFWKPGMSLAYPAYHVSDAAAHYRRSLVRLTTWKKLFTGKVDVTGFAQVMARRVAFLAGGILRDLARRVGRPMAEDLGVELQTAARRGIGMRFVFATGDPGEDLLRSQAGSSVRRLLREGRLSIRRIDGPNHTFTPVWSHAVLTEALEEELDVR